MINVYIASHGMHYPQVYFVLNKRSILNLVTRCYTWKSSPHPYPEPVVFQWQSSANPVCLELRPQCTLECHWRSASVLPVVFQLSSSGFPVVFQCVPVIQINNGSPLKHHWVLASASVVPVASQCTCGSSGLPVWSVQGYPSVLTASGLEIIRSGHFPACDP